MITPPPAHSRTVHRIPVEVGVCETALATRPGPLLSALSDVERRCYEAISHPGRRRQYLASRWLLRQHLSHEMGQPAQDVPVAFSAGRAPELSGDKRRLGLSHSVGLCLCVSALEVPVGCDVEAHRTRPRMRRLAQQYFAPAEAAHLRRLDESRLLPDFYRLWTLKEASHKALQLGLSHGLRKPAFDWEAGFRCLVAPDEGPWQFCFTEIAAGSDRYTLALAVRAEAVTVRVTQYVAMGAGAQRQPLTLSWGEAL